MGARDEPGCAQQGRSNRAAYSDMGSFAPQSRWCRTCLAGVPMSEPHCPTCICGRRAPVQGCEKSDFDGTSVDAHDPGTISFEEHCLAWSGYAAKYGKGQSAETMSARGGFSFWELTNFLGHEPKTWSPR